MKALYQSQTSKEFFTGCFRGKGSLAIASRRLGYASPRLLEMVCQGTRLASEDFLFRTKNYLKLTDQEFLFLGMLVRRDRERLRGRNHSLLNAEIETFSRLAIDQQYVDEKMLKMVYEWPHFVLKQFFRSPRKISPEKIAQKLGGKISARQAKATLQTLVDLGIVHFNPETNEILPRMSKGFVSQNDVPSHAIRSHHRQMMERAQEALEEVPLLEREITALTISFNQKNLLKVKNEIREFKNRMDLRYGEDHGDSVYQLNVQFFPHTR